MFSRSNLSIVLSLPLPDETGSQKSKMAAEIMQLHVYQLIHDSNTILNVFSAIINAVKNNDAVQCLGMS